MQYILLLLESDDENSPLRVKRTSARCTGFSIVLSTMSKRPNLSLGYLAVKVQ